MSSILDALNKLEEEKARAQRELEERDIDPVEAAEELVGGRPLNRRVSFKMRPAALVAAIVGVLLLFVGVSVGTTLMVMRSTAPAAEIAGVVPTVTASALGEPNPSNEEASLAVSAADAESTEAAPVTNSPPEPAPVVSEPVAEVAERVAPKPIETARAEVTPSLPKPAEIIETPKVDSPKPAAEPERVVEVIEKPAPEEIVVARSEPPAAQTEPPPVDKPLRQLPVLMPADAARYGLDRLMLNMVKPAGPTNPYGFALVNKEKVYEGQRIPGSQLVLYRVEMVGVGVQVAGGSRRYFVPF